MFCESQFSEKPAFSVKKKSTFQKSYLDLVQQWHKSHKNMPDAIATLPHTKPLRATLIVAACKQCCQMSWNLKQRVV
jgi:hypothetical protein